MKRRQSILITFVASSAVLLLLTIIFNSLVIKGQIKQYQKMSQGQRLINLSNALFQVVRHYGFERGRVNVVLNFQGPPEKIQESVDFLRDHRNAGDKLLQEVLTQISTEKIFTDAQEIDEITRQQRSINALRTRYEQQLALPFTQRDMSLDERWFNSMSAQIRHLTFLLYALKESYDQTAFQVRHLEIFYLLTQLRDDTGPVVSYLKGASFNLGSLSVNRINEIKYRKSKTLDAVKELKIIGSHGFSDEINARIAAFDAYYFGDFYALADHFFVAVEERRAFKAEFDNYLTNGVQALEMLNSVSEELASNAIQQTSTALQNQKIMILASVISSLFVLAVIGYFLREAYAYIYVRTIKAADIIAKLSAGQTDVLPTGALHPDELGDIENGLLNFKNTLTGLTELNEQLRQAKVAAESANVAKSQFLANMSHEIRSPMNGILGMTQILEMTPLTAEQRECTDALKYSGKNLLSLIDDILDLSKIEAGESTFEQKDFNLRVCINDVVKMQNTLLGPKDVTLDVEVAADVPQFLVGDQTRIKQVLHNLIGNAVKFTEHGAVTVSTQLLAAGTLSQRIKIEVRDTGIGISSDALERIFLPFIQEDASITRKYGGTGLGLAISQNLAELMGGHITVESTLGAGSLFTLTLPLIAAAPKRDSQIPATDGTDKPAGQPLRILFAEDDPVNSTVGSKMLRKLGHEVRVVENGYDCLAALGQGEFDVVLMDIQMPIMSGRDALCEIRKKEQVTHTHLPVIALTAFAMQGEKESFLAAGFDGYVSKPIEFSDLLREIKQVIGPPTASTSQEG